MNSLIRDFGPESIKELIGFISEFILPERVEKLKNSIDNRTRHLTIVLENIYQAQNASAVLRSCECFGIQDVHIIENSNEFVLHPQIVMGATKWLDLFHYNQKADNTLDCIKSLKSKGYQIIATTPVINGHTIFDLPLDQKTALFFGTELTGLSQTVIDQADGFMSIPMHGFTESLNISVTSAISAFHLTHRMRTEQIHWQLSEDERNALLASWMLDAMRRPEILVKKFIKDKDLHVEA